MKAVVAVISNLTQSEAAQISADILKAKSRHAKAGSATVFVTSHDRIRQAIDAKQTKAIGRKEH